MALEINQTSLGETRPSGTSIQPGDLNIPTEVLKSLQLPEHVTDQQVVSFLSLQSSRLISLQSTEPPYSLDAAVPPPPSDLFQQSAENELPDVELQALEEFVADMKGGKMGAASTSDDYNNFRNTMENILPELRKKAPPRDLVGMEEGGGAVAQWLNMQISALSEEREKEWATLLDKLRTDPKAGIDTYLLALGYYMTESKGAQLSKAFKMFHQSTALHEEKLASLQLDQGASAGDMFDAQTENQAYMIDTQMAMQTMQSLRQDMDKVQLQVQSTVRSVHQTLSDIRRNITS